ncbi:ubc-9 [Symbiodinium sp. KB8]|nr:ubc-9 [Symbiodinium sp. KB8]
MASAGFAEERLTEERKHVRRERPHGFFAKPVKKPDGSMDLFTWTAGVPGEAGTPWEGGVYKLNMYFPEDFPAKPPKCQFDPPLFHPNVYPSGTICLSILNAEKGWEPSHSVLQVLKGVQLLLNTPNLDDPAQREAYDLMR